VGSFSICQYIRGIEPILDEHMIDSSVCKSSGGKVLLVASTLHGVVGIFLGQTSLDYFSNVHLLALAP